MTLTKGQYQLGDIVMGANTNIIVTGFEVQPYDINAQDYQISRTDEMRFGYDSFKPTSIQMTMEVIYNWLLPPFQNTIPNFWKDKPTVNDLAQEWRANDVRTQWGQIKPLFYCGRDNVNKMIFGRPGQFSAEKPSHLSTVVKCVGEFRRADTLNYTVEEYVVQLGPNTVLNRNGGDSETWCRLIINGANNPVLSINGKTVEIVASASVIELSSYPWSRRVVSDTGVNLRSALSTSSAYLDKITLPMGTSEVRLLSGASSAYLLWRDAWSAVE